VRKRRLKQGRADAGVVAKQKRKVFLPEEFFPLLARRLFGGTCPLMGGPFTDPPMCHRQAADYGK